MTMPTEAPLEDTQLTDQRVIVLDFGSQYAQLIARRVREQNVYCQIVRHDLSAERIAELKPMGIILSGGPSSVYETGAPRCDPKLFELGIPVLGICYGMQLACEASVARWNTRPVANMVEPPAEYLATNRCSMVCRTRPMFG